MITKIYSRFLLVILTTLCCTCIHSKNEKIETLVKEIVTLNRAERHEIAAFAFYALTSCPLSAEEFARNYINPSINHSIKTTLLTCRIISLVNSFYEIIEFGNALSKAENKIDLANEMWDSLSNRGICCEHRALMSVISTLIGHPFRIEATKLPA